MGGLDVRRRINKQPSDGSEEACFTLAKHVGSVNTGSCDGGAMGGTSEPGEAGAAEPRL